MHYEDIKVFAVMSKNKLLLQVKKNWNIDFLIQGSKLRWIYNFGKFVTPPNHTCDDDELSVILPKLNLIISE